MATPSFESARTRKMLVDAAIAEMELAKARKEYVAAEDVEGNRPRTMFLEVGSGKTWFTTRGEVHEL